jgi:hypothetical protein
MKRITDFFGGLKKSTKITVISCSSFVVLTVLILAFFMMFPITPSERVMDSIGRENISQDKENQPVQSGVPGVETTVSTTVTTKATTARVTSTRSKTSFTITITTGSGFMWNGRIPTGGIPGQYETTTTAVDQTSPYEGTTGEAPTYQVTTLDPNIVEPPTTGGGNTETPTGNDPQPAVTASPDPVVTPPTNGGGNEGGGGSGGGNTGTW